MWCYSAKKDSPQRLAWWERRLSVTTTVKWLDSPSEFDPFCLITFWESQRAPWFNHFIPIQVKFQGLNQKLAISSGRSLHWAYWVIPSLEWEVFFLLFYFWLHAPVSNFHGNEQGCASDTVSSSHYTSMTPPHIQVSWRASLVCYYHLPSLNQHCDFTWEFPTNTQFVIPIIHKCIYQ